MAKTQTISSLPPEIFAFGAKILDEHSIAAIEQVNYSFGAGVGQVLIAERASATFPTSAGEEAYFVGYLWIDADAVTVEFSSNATFPAANSGYVGFTLGAATQVTIAHSAGATTSGTVTQTVANTGSGLLVLGVVLNHNVGAGLNSTLNSWGVRVLPVSSSLPSPENA